MKKTIDIRSIHDISTHLKNKTLRLESKDIILISIDVIFWYVGRDRLRFKKSGRPLKARKEKYRSLMFRSKWKYFD